MRGIENTSPQFQLQIELCIPAGRGVAILSNPLTRCCGQLVTFFQRSHSAGGCSQVHYCTSPVEQELNAQILYWGRYYRQILPGCLCTGETRTLSHYSLKQPAHRHEESPLRALGYLPLVARQRSKDKPAINNEHRPKVSPPATLSCGKRRTASGTLLQVKTSSALLGCHPSSSSLLHERMACNSSLVLIRETV